MFKNYLKIAIRNLSKQKLSTTINIVGLSVGFAVFFLTGLYVLREFSYDSFHPQAEKIQLLGMSEPDSRGDVRLTDTVTIPFARSLKAEIPEIEQMTLLHYAWLNWDNGLELEYQNQRHKLFHMAFCDSNFAEMFTFPVLDGNLDMAVKTSHSLIITASLAQRLFGNEPALDKVVYGRNGLPLTVRAVLQDLPENSSIQFQGLVTLSSAKAITGSDLEANSNDHSTYAFMTLHPRSNIPDVLGKMRQVYLRRFENMDLPADIKPMLQLFQFHLTPLKDIYFGNPKLASDMRHGSRTFTFIFLTIGVIILLLAVSNFINLTIARATRRFKEVGVRKLSGASRTSLISQFIVEAVILCLIAFGLSFLLIEIFFKPFNYLLEFEMISNLWSNPVCLILSFIAVVITGVVAGVFPARFLIRFEPARVLKGEFAKGRKGVAFLKKLVVFQFSISIILMICTLLINSQMNFIKNKDLGFDKNNCIYIPFNRNVGQNNQAFKQAVLGLSNVAACGLSGSFVGGVPSHWGLPVEEAGESRNVNFGTIRVDEDYFTAIRAEIVEGRNFSPEMVSDINAWIINQAAVREFGLFDPLKAKLGGQPIVGVVKDFNAQTLHYSVAPTAFMFDSRQTANANIRFASDDPQMIQQTLLQLGQIWQQFETNEPFEYHFMDQAFNALYQKEQKLFRVFIYFTFIALMIGCLGLLGLVTFTTQNRTKEIGVRKVLGASVFGIVGLLSKDFTKWILFANIIAWPVAWYAMNQWLRNFAYRVHLNWWIFILSGMLALIIALLTVGYQAMRAATANPVESLRYE